MLYNFNEVYKERAYIELENGREVEGWFVDGLRIDPNTIGEGMYWYQTRHSDYDWCEPISIVQGGILVNFCGTFITDVDLELTEETEITDFGYIAD